MLQYGPLKSYLYKDSISVRGFYWRAALEMFQSHPLFGVGLDRYGAFFKSYREPEYSLKYGYQINSNNAHNLYLQFFSTGGLLLGLSYLLLNISVFVISLKLIRNSLGDTREVALILLSAWLAFQAQSIISIDSIGLSIWGWLISGALLALARSTHTPMSQQIHSRKKITINSLSLEIYQKLIVTLLLAPTLIVFYFISQSESDTLRSRFFTAPGQDQNRSVVQEYAAKVLNNSFSDPQYRLFVLMNMYDMGLRAEALEGIKLLESLDPINLDVLNSLAIISQENGEFVISINFREKIANIDPWNAENYLNLVKLYKQVNNENSARSTYNKIISFAPNSEPAIQAGNILN
jgi:tetratricopeptide (TPR) repeat protein